MTELNIVLTSFKLIDGIIILSMANQGGDVDWDKNVNRRNHTSTSFGLCWKRRCNGLNKSGF